MAKKKAEEKVVRRGMTLGDTAMAFLPDAVAAESVPLDHGFRMSVNGLVTPAKDPTLGQCEKVGVTLRIAERGAQFALGDFINYVEAKFGEDTAAQIIDAGDGWSEKTVSVYRWLSSRIRPDVRRMDRLGVLHHLAVAALTPAKQHHWLAKAANDDGDKPWTVSELSSAMASGGDAPEAGFWVVVAAKDAADQTKLMEQLEKQGRTVKAKLTRGKRAIGKPDTDIEP